MVPWSASDHNVGHGGLHRSHDPSHIVDVQAEKLRRFLVQGQLGGFHVPCGHTVGHQVGVCHQGHNGVILQALARAMVVLNRTGRGGWEIPAQGHQGPYIGVVETEAKLFQLMQPVAAGLGFLVDLDVVLAQGIEHHNLAQVMQQPASVELVGRQSAAALGVTGELAAGLRCQDAVAPELIDRESGYRLQVVELLNDCGLRDNIAKHAHAKTEEACSVERQRSRKP